MHRKDHDMTMRALMALVNDLAEHMSTAERIRIQIAALAARHGVSMPAVAD